MGNREKRRIEGSKGDVLCVQSVWVEVRGLQNGSARLSQCMICQDKQSLACMRDICSAVRDGQPCPDMVRKSMRRGHTTLNGNRRTKPVDHVLAVVAAGELHNSDGFGARCIQAQISF